MCGLTVDAEGRQMAQRRDSALKKEMEEGHEESNQNKECERRGIDYERVSSWA